MDQYREAHLYVAAIRLLSHRQPGAPAMSDIGALLDVSQESALAVCRRLAKQDIVKLIDDPFTVRVTIENHLAIEDLPREEKQNDALSQELEKFMAKKQEMNKKVESIQAEMAKKRQDLFSDMEQKLKKQLADMKKG